MHVQSLQFRKLSRVDRVRIAARRQFISVADRWGPLAEAAVVLCGSLLVFAGILVSSWFTGHFAPTLTEFVTLTTVTVVGAAITAFTTYSISRAKRSQHILIELTLSYIVKGGKELLDDILGKMISGRWRREELRPGTAFFDVLDHTCASSEWEQKRRVAEAVPVLSSIDLLRTLRLVDKLRDDWDPVRWRSDLRRRAVESLVLQYDSGPALLVNAGQEHLTRLLCIHEGDEIYTAIAIAEVLGDLEAINAQFAANLRRDLLARSQVSFPADQHDAVYIAVQFTALLRDGSARDHADFLSVLLKSANQFLRIVAARNLWHLVDRLPDEMLDMMLACIDPIQPANVRRPISKEASMNCILRLVCTPNHHAKAFLLLNALASDSDEIIRVTALEKAEQLRDERPDLLLELCAAVKDTDGSELVRTRAARLYNEVKEEVPSTEVDEETLVFKDIE